jgi:hypothetical protein
MGCGSAGEAVKLPDGRWRGIGFGRCQTLNDADENILEAARNALAAISTRHNAQLPEQIDDNNSINRSRPFWQS